MAMMACHKSDLAHFLGVFGHILFFLLQRKFRAHASFLASCCCDSQSTLFARLSFLCSTLLGTRCTVLLLGAELYNPVPMAKTK